MNPNTMFEIFTIKISLTFLSFDQTSIDKLVLAEHSLTTSDISWNWTGLECIKIYSKATSFFLVILTTAIIRIIILVKTVKAAREQLHTTQILCRSLFFDIHLCISNYECTRKGFI